MRRWNAETVIALAFIVIGVLLLAGNLGLIAFNWGVVWSLVLIGLGAWLVWRAFQPTSSALSFGLGNYRLSLDGKEIREEDFSHGLGDFDLDLTRAVIPEGTSRVRAWLGMGDVTVIVPRDLAVRVRASAGMGSVRVFQNKDEGMSPSIDFESNDYATATRKLDLEVNAGMGEVKVLRGE